MKRKLGLRDLALSKTRGCRGLGAGAVLGLLRRSRVLRLTRRAFAKLLLEKLALALEVSNSSRVRLVAMVIYSGLVRRDAILDVGQLVFKFCFLLIVHFYSPIGDARAASRPQRRSTTRSCPGCFEVGPTASVRGSNLFRPERRGLQ